MLIPKFKATCKNGKVLFENRQEFDRYILTLGNNRLDVVVSKYKKDRSLDQNAYYWGVVVKMLTEETGHDKDEIHAHFSYEFLGFYKVVLGKDLRIVPSTTSLKTDQFEDYLAKIRMWASKELSLFIPDPERVEY